MVLRPEAKSAQSRVKKSWNGNLVVISVRKIIKKFESSYKKLMKTRIQYENSLYRSNEICILQRSFLAPLGLWVASYFKVIIHYFLLTFWNKVPRITQFARIVRGLDDFLTTFLQNEDEKVQRLPKAWLNIFLNWYFSSMESNRSKYKIYHRIYGKSGELVAIIVILFCQHLLV